jgi:hypothetical protein
MEREYDAWPCKIPSSEAKANAAFDRVVFDVAQMSRSSRVLMLSI